MSRAKKESDVFYITHSGELLIWLIVLLFITIFCVFLNIKHTKAANDYTIFMEDVDGLIVGSPVRMMGVEVGHITKIKPTNEEVYVKFILLDKEMEIPQGTVATVEFSGMAGSKSLELYLPDENTYIDNNVQIITVHPPKRLHDALGLLNDMFDKLGSIIYTSTSFAEKVKDIELPNVNNQDYSKLLKSFDEQLENSNRKAKDFNTRMKNK